MQDKAADLAAVTRYAQHAAQHGADAIVSLPPAHVTDEKVLLDYYQQVGNLTDLPLFVQSQGKMSIDLIVEIYNTVPTVRQVKDEAGDPLARITELRRRTNDELKVFSGNGVRTMINEMELGFMGHCPTTGLADLYAAAFDLWHAGQHQEAFDMFGRICAFDSLGTTDHEQRPGRPRGLSGDGQRPQGSADPRGRRHGRAGHRRPASAAPLGRRGSRRRDRSLPQAVPPGLGPGRPSR